jgi:hypothetical protein
MMPIQVREILLEEGLTKDVIDSTLGVDEKRHRKTMQLTLLAEDQIEPRFSKRIVSENQMLP